MSLSSSGNSLSPSVVANGLVSGLNTSAIIQAELQPFEIPINNLQSEQSTISSNVTDYQQINSDLLALKGTADLLAMASGWNARSATSSNSTVATATAAPGTPTGSIQFTVSQLAAANSIFSSGFATSTSQIVTTASDLLLSEGAGQLGFASLANGSPGGTGVSVGAHTVSVTQSSAAASSVGSIAIGTSSGATSITTGSNDTVNVTVNGTAYNLTLAASPAGGYTASGLLSAVQSAISSAGAGGVLQAGYDASGHLVLATVDQGSSQTLQVTGGDALGTLGLATSSSTGQDAVVEVDGTANTVSTVVPGAALTLNGPAGSTITATLAASTAQQYANSSLVSVGSVNATDVSTGSGSLADVVAAINSSGTGILASSVQTGTNQYVLQLSSSTTGTNGDLSLDMNAFSGSSLGTMKTAVAGQNAEIQVGGPTGYTISSQTDTFTGLLPGLSVTAQQVSTNPVTVSVGRDGSAMASSVQQLVDDANTVLSDLQKYAGYNQATKTGGPLMGSAVLQGLTNSVLAAVASSVGASNLGSAANVGITISNGQLAFDSSKFQTAFDANPAQVQSLFTQGGTFSPSAAGYSGQVALSYASGTTRTGSYDVQVSQSATQAAATGTTLSSGTVGAGETLTVSLGSTSAAYTTAAGQSLSSVADGLNAAFASQGLALSAQVVNGNQLKLVSTAYGSATSFTVSTSSTAAGTLGLTGSSSSATFSGTDVAGTINGVAATGRGQFLAAPATDPTLAGLVLQVTASGISSPTSLGTFSYTPGLAQVMSSVADAMSKPVSGSITQTVSNLQQQSTSITPQIQMYQQIVNREQQLLMAKYATMESVLGSLKNQSSALAGELATIQANG
jgi:flagellar hook-associated protein 2